MMNQMVRTKSRPRLGPDDPIGTAAALLSAYIVEDTQDRRNAAWVGFRLALEHYAGHSGPFRLEDVRKVSELVTQRFTDNLTDSLRARGNMSNDMIDATEHELVEIAVAMMNQFALWLK
jgi:hypothetical protein